MAPYTFACWPDRITPLDHVAVVGSDVAIRAAPSTRSSLVASVGFEILQLSPESLKKAWDREAWTEVVVQGRKGYVATMLIRSPAGYRAVFANLAGRWRMTEFVAGE